MDDLFWGFVCLTGLTATLIITLYFRKGKNRKALKIFSFLSLNIVFLLVLFFGKKYSILLLFTYPPFFLYYFGRSGGFNLIVLSLIAFPIFFFSEKLGLENIYSIEFKIRFLISYGIFLYASYYYELLRDKLDDEIIMRNGEYNEVLGNINKMTQLLPVCQSCKKIRTDNGDFVQLEEYISSNSNIDFSHGICPDCVKKLYPDLYKD